MRASVSQSCCRSDVVVLLVPIQQCIIFWVRVGWGRGSGVEGVRSIQNFLKPRVSIGRERLQELKGSLGARSSTAISVLQLKSSPPFDDSTLSQSRTPLTKEY